MRYAGFWSRLGAGFIDLLVFIPIVILYFWLRTLSWEVALISHILNSLLYFLYNIYFLGRWGQTIGKWASNIKVVRLNGSKINFKDAFMRHCVDMVFSILSSTAWVITMLSITTTTFESTFLSEGSKIIHEATPVWGVWASKLSTIWVLSEMIVLLFNKKKRAIHDFIAGTVVIHTEPVKEMSNNEARREPNGAK